tara:strand:+ start:415 stop:657 length:243 start_codon:yes stop_codon:yes gene_type:complete
MIRQKNEMKEIVVDLDGPDGNAYVLLGYANGYAKQLNFDIKEIHEEMTSGDYKNLLNVFQKYFPFVILETNQTNLLEKDV